MSVNTTPRQRRIPTLLAALALAAGSIGLSATTASAYTGSNGCISHSFSQYSDVFVNYRTVRLTNNCSVTERVKLKYYFYYGAPTSGWGACTNIAPRSAVTFRSQYNMLLNSGSQLTGDWVRC